MALTNLAQIKGGLQLRTDVNALQTSYDGAKVTTTVVKTAAKGENAAVNYNANELLGVLKASVDSITGTGGSGTSLSTLDTAIKALQDKTIKDVVKYTFSAAYTAPATGTAASVDDYAVNASTLTTTTVPGFDNTVALKVYNVDNTSVLDATGAQLTFTPSTGKFSGVPSVLDVSASKAKTDGTMVYAPLNKTFSFKVFPVGTWKFSELPTDAMLDNDEMQLIAYDQAINKIVVELASDKDLMDSIKALVGTTAVQTQITTITDALKAKLQTNIDKKVDKDAIVKAVSTDSTTASDTNVPSDKAVGTYVTNSIDTVKNTLSTVDTNLAERISAVEKMVAPIDEKFAIDATATAAAPKTTFALTQKPNDVLVKAIINHMVYVEGEDFTVARDTKTVTWTLTAAHQGFDITNDLTDAVRFTYQTGEAVANTSTVTILHQDAIPTTGTFKVGDMVYRTTPVSTKNVGWICSAAGTPGTWMEFGVTDFAHTIYVTESGS